MTKSIQVEIIPQLKDNYSYLVYSYVKKLAVVIDPAEAGPIIEFIKSKNLFLSGILVTHHHADHTSGINNLLKFQPTEVFSPNLNIIGTSKIIKENDLINLDFIEFKVIATPGHTLDHIVFCNQKNKLLFSGDTLFRFGCGRIFEGTYNQMAHSLNKLEKLPDSINVYCGHEYTLHNLNFLQSVFYKHQLLKNVESKILYQLKKFKSSMPFVLGDEKKLNPFLCIKSSYYSDFMKKKDFDTQKMFKYLRDLRNNF